MILKNVVTTGLLLFVAVAVVTVVVKSSSQSNSPGISSTESKQVSDLGLPADGLIATFFHGETRCPTCRKIEDYAHKALDEEFADEIRSGEIQWRTTNYADPENKQLAKDYKVFSSTVVLVRVADGKTTDWRNLEQVWDFVEDEDAFKDYVQAETREMLSL